MDQGREEYMKQIILDGNNFSNIEEFYDEIDRLLTKDLGWKTGHNLDAFNDLQTAGRKRRARRMSASHGRTSLRS